MKNKNLKIYVLGNLLVEKDSLPLQLVPKLKEVFPRVEFVIVDPNENFPPPGEKDLVILDTVLGINEPKILNLTDFDNYKKTPISPHDYDLLIHLLLLKKMNKINNVKIIGVLPNKSIKTALKSVINLINKI